MTAQKMMEALMLLNANDPNYWFLTQETEESLTFQALIRVDGFVESYHQVVVVIYEAVIGIHEMDMDENIIGTAFLTRFEWQTFLSIQQLKFPNYEELEFTADPKWLFS